MAQVTETVARGILAGHGYTDNEVRQLAHHWLASHGQAPAETGNSVSAQADSVQEDAARYRFLRDGEWRDTDLEPFIRLQLNTLWDAKIDDARAAQEGKPCA